MTSCLEASGLLVTETVKLEGDRAGIKSLLAVADVMPLLGEERQYDNMQMELSLYDHCVPMFT